MFLDVLSIQVSGNPPSEKSLKFIYNFRMRKHNFLVRGVIETTRKRAFISLLRGGGYYRRKRKKRSHPVNGRVSILPSERRKSISAGKSKGVPLTEERGVKVSQRVKARRVPLTEGRRKKRLAGKRKRVPFTEREEKKHLAGKRKGVSIYRGREKKHLAW